MLDVLMGFVYFIIVWIIILFVRGAIDKKFPDIALSEEKSSKRILDINREEDRQLIYNSFIEIYRCSDEYWDGVRNNRRNLGQFSVDELIYRGKFNDDFVKWLSSYKGKGDDVVIRIRGVGIVPYEEHCIYFNSNWIPEAPLYEDLLLKETETA